MHELARTQQLPISLEEAWAFFSSPKNLPKITPEGMGFDITTGPDGLETMYAGQVIGYRVRPVLGIPMRWVTEITHVREGEFFVDEQRIGPYSFWHHKHFFKEVPGGTEVRDLVHYQVPFGPLGRLANRFFVRKKLEMIFDYRQRRLESLFGTVAGR